MNEHRTITDVLGCTLSTLYEVEKRKLPGLISTCEALVLLSKM